MYSVGAASAAQRAESGDYVASAAETAPTIK